MSDNDLLVCKVDAIAPAARARHFDLISQWREAVTHIEELPTGYAFRLAADKVSWLALAEFVDRERRCCPFFQFEIVIEANGGPLWLRLLGGPTVKRFVQDTLLVQA